MSGLRERGKADRRGRILLAAQRGLEEYGYEAMTVAQVAADADVAVGTVFQYASTKAELLMMATVGRWEAWAEGLRRPQHGPDPLGEILALLQPVIDQAVASQVNSAAIARELLFGSEGPHRSALIEIISRLEGVICELLSSAGADAERAGAASGMIVSGALLEANRTWRHAAGPESLRARVERVVAITVAGALCDAPNA